jgi:SAM-dependent methyltransferase
MTMLDNHRGYLETLAAPFQPQRPMEELVVEMNRLFFDTNAHLFEGKHPEIFEQLPPIWKRLMAKVQSGSRAPWRILDFGSGVGFCGDMALDLLPHGDIERLTSVDFAPAILDLCRERLSRRFPRGEYLRELPAAPPPGGYNLLLTNAVLHHLADVDRHLAEIERTLAPDAWWVLGHEPSARFYRNPECLRVLAAERKANRWNRFVRPSKYARRLSWLTRGDMNKRAATRCVELGLFARKPSHVVIDRIVDCGVANSADEAAVGRGYCFEELQRRLAGRWALEMVETYSFMGIHYEGDLTPYWRGQAEQLRRKFPQDGANFCAVWRRVG